MRPINNYFVWVLVFVPVLGAGGMHCGRVDSNPEREKVAPKPREPVQKSSSALISEAQELREKGHFRRALRRFRSALNRDPENRTAWMGLAKVALQMDRPEVSIPFARKAVRKHSGQPVALNFLGVSYVAAGRYENAIETFERALRKAPNDPVILANIVRSLLESGQETRARRYAFRMTETFPDLVRPWMMIARSFVQEGSLKKAIKPLKIAIKRDPENGRAYYHLGRLYRRLDQHEKAREQFRKALKRNPPTRVRRLMEEWIE